MKRAFVLAASALTLWGCADPPPPVLPKTSFDGHYRGTVELTAPAAGLTREQCATDRAMAVEVRGNAFTYAQPHRNLAGTGAGLTTESTTITYTATIAPDGILRGTSDRMGGTIAGHAGNGHIDGRIDGALCYYRFSLERLP